MKRYNIYAYHILDEFHFDVLGESWYYNFNIPEEHWSIAIKKTITTSFLKEKNDDDNNNFSCSKSCTLVEKKIQYKIQSIWK